jgi:hypothetical protein
MSSEISDTKTIQIINAPTTRRTRKNKKSDNSEEDNTVSMEKLNIRSNSININKRNANIANNSVNAPKINMMTGGYEEIKGVPPTAMAVKGYNAPSIASHAASSNSSKWLYIPNIPSTPGSQIGGESCGAGSCSIPPPSQPITGGAHDKHIKVELKKSATPKRVHLTPKKHAAPQTHILKKAKTRKNRKVTVGVSSLSKRVTRAKKYKEKVTKMSLSELKEQLVKKGLIKATSKAPESVLRQMAIDAHIVAGKAL